MLEPVPGAYAPDPKPEYRSSKEGRNPKAEARSFFSSIGAKLARSAVVCQPELLNGPHSETEV
jgi:hypothetical protein